MASEGTIIAQRLECSLCCDLMEEPKLLSCAHTFCKYCLVQLYQCQRKRDNISCPVCRKTTRLQNGDVSRLQTNGPIKAKIGDINFAQRNGTAQAFVDLGQVIRKTKWELERVNTYPLAGENVRDLLPTRVSGMAVGYFGGGLQIFTVDCPLKKISVDVEGERISTLSDGRYIIRGGMGTTLTLYTKEWKRESVTFHTPFGELAGLCVDNHDNIYVGYYDSKKIAKFRPEGGAPIKEITSPGLSPWYIRHTNHSNLLVVTDGSTVRLIDEEGTVKHDVNKDGCLASIAVLQDDSILIAWQKDGLLTIDLYTTQLKYVRTVLSKFKIEGDTCCLAEFSTGEIAFPDGNKFYVFRKT